MVVPESQNNRPEIQDQKNQEVQAANPLQQEAQGSLLDLDSIKTAFSGPDNAKAVVGDLALSDDKATSSSDANTAESDDIANMTEAQLAEAIGAQKIAVSRIESELASTQKVAERAGIEQQAAKLAEAAEYFASGKN